MKESQCPVCFGPLEVRDVTPCQICGGWPELVARFRPEASFKEYRLPNGQTIVLCSACEVEEFMVPGGWGYRLGLSANRLPINSLAFVRNVHDPEIRKDKFCNGCNLRLAFLEVVAAHGNHVPV